MLSYRRSQPESEFNVRSNRKGIHKFCRFCHNITTRFRIAVSKGKLNDPHGRGMPYMRKVYRGEVKWDKATRRAMLLSPEQVTTFDKILAAHGATPAEDGCPSDVCTCVPSEQLRLVHGTRHADTASPATRDHVPTSAHEKVHWDSFVGAAPCNTSQARQVQNEALHGGRHVAAPLQQPAAAGKAQKPTHPSSEAQSVSRTADRAIRSEDIARIPCCVAASLGTQRPPRARASLSAQPGDTAKRVGTRAVASIAAATATVEPSATRTRARAARGVQTLHKGTMAADPATNDVSNVLPPDALPGTCENSTGASHTAANQAVASESTRHGAEHSCALAGGGDVPADAAAQHNHAAGHLSHHSCEATAAAVTTHPLAVAPGATRQPVVEGGAPGDVFGAACTSGTCPHPVLYVLACCMRMCAHSELLL